MTDMNIGELIERLEKMPPASAVDVCVIQSRPMTKEEDVPRGLIATGKLTDVEYDISKERCIISSVLFKTVM